MFEHLSDESCIIVTGPQRSGTTIAAKMIAHDTGLRYVDEDNYGVHDEERFREACSQPRVVVHAPAMMHVVNEVSGRPRQTS